ncbi:ComF family protein [Paenibacillus mendelii]|uniref:ComF family protein n=1 Tax=Paenibacillus mendelii TaxID=206163 RepID=A0ABV6J3H5_9BACL|nr:ComF family protein [Paenibacillus mendelii]MCQ6563553.1 ComF family protein [Paenibacillus mendelii]
MNPLLRYMRQFIPSAIRTSISMLSPLPSACLTCNRTYSENHRPVRSGLHDSSEFRSLCPDCRIAIPWITRIVCQVCGRPGPCGDCARRTDSAFVCNRSAVSYDEVIRGWLALYKYRGHEGLGLLLGEMMQAAYCSMHRDLKQRLSAFHFDAVIPVPLSEARLVERGFNQAEQLASAVAVRNQLPLVQALRRTRHSDKQSYKTRGARLRDTRNLFAAEEAGFATLVRLVDGRTNESSLSNPVLRLLLVDDIYTTGSTVDACSRAILDSMQRSFPEIHTEVYVLTLARS